MVIMTDHQFCYTSCSEGEKADEVIESTAKEKASKPAIMRLEGTFLSLEAFVIRTRDLCVPKL